MSKEDKVYKKQLEEFGVESVIVTEENLKKRLTNEQRDANLSTVQAVMETMEGRRWMYEKLEMARVFAVPFVPGQPDVSAFLSGVQAFGQILLAEVMGAAPDQFYLMNQEATARKMTERKISS